MIKETQDIKTRINDLCDKVAYNPKIDIRVYPKGDFIFLAIERNKIKGRKWYMSPFMTDGEILQTIFKAIMTFEEHEIRENFTYKGRRIFGPHQSIEDLVTITEDYRVDER